jgi:beta-barrel assembly-enhancing protease
MRLTPIRKFVSLAMTAFCLVILSSCLTLEQSVDVFASQVSSQGFLSRYQVAMLKAAAKAASETARQLSPEEEYYIGRAVAASIFSSYPPYVNRELNAYLNKLGQGLALYSSRPEIFDGYRFISLASTEVNAFATPGGHILIARGLLRLVQSEDELAAVLAHEIAHVALGHGLSSVQGAKIAKIASEFAIDAGNAAGGNVAAFTTVFGDSIADLARILVISGYSQTYELQADLEARHILAAAGYDPKALARLIGRLPSRNQDPAGFAVTHPEPSVRLEALASHPLEDTRNMAVKRIMPMARTMDSMQGNEEFLPPLLVRTERFSAMRSFF